MRPALTAGSFGCVARVGLQAAVLAQWDQSSTFEEVQHLQTRVALFADLAVSCVDSEPRTTALATVLRLWQTSSSGDAAAAPDAHHAAWHALLLQSALRPPGSNWGLLLPLDEHLAGSTLTCHRAAVLTLEEERRIFTELAESEAEHAVDTGRAFAFGLTSRHGAMREVGHRGVGRLPIPPFFFLFFRRDIVRRVRV